MKHSNIIRFCFIVCVYTALLCCPALVGCRLTGLPLLWSLTIPPLFFILALFLFPAIVEHSLTISWLGNDDIPERLLEMFDLEIPGSKHPRIGVIDSAFPLLFSYGRPLSASNIIISNSATEILSTEEFSSLIIRELYYVRKKDYIFTSMVYCIPALCVYLNTKLSSVQEEKISPVKIFLSSVLFFIYRWTDSLASLLVDQRNTAADMYTIEKTDNPDLFISALQKSYEYIYQLVPQKLKKNEACLAHLKNLQFIDMDKALALKYLYKKSKNYTEALREDYTTYCSSGTKMLTIKMHPVERLAAIEEKALDMGFFPTSAFKSMLQDSRFSFRLFWFTYSNIIHLMISFILGTLLLIVFDSIFTTVFTASIFYFIVSALSLNRLYETDAFEPYTIEDMIYQTELIRGLSIPVQIQVTVQWIECPFTFTNEYFILRDNSGYILMNPEKSISIGSYMTNIYLKYNKEHAKQTLWGWFFDIHEPHIEIYRLEKGGYSFPVLAIQYVTHIVFILLLSLGLIVSAIQHYLTCG